MAGGTEPHRPQPQPHYLSAVDYIRSSSPQVYPRNGHAAKLSSNGESSSADDLLARGKSRLKSYDPQTLPPDELENLRSIAANIVRGQSLASVLLNPNKSQRSVLERWHDAADTNDATSIPPLAPGVLPPIVPKEQIKEYIKNLRAVYAEFISRRSEIENNEGRNRKTISTSSGRLRGSTHGDGLVVCMREIPSLFFSDDFCLESYDTYVEATASGKEEGKKREEKLGNYLDLVEEHILREISARSDSFFEALSVLQSLTSQIHNACQEIGEAREHMRESASNIVETHKRLRMLRQRRENMEKTQKLLSNLNELKSAESTLKLLMAAGDYSAALDVLDSFEGMLDSKQDTTDAKDSKSSRVDINNVNLLLCFRSLPLYLKTARQEVDRALTDDLIREITLRYRGSPENDLGSDEQRCFESAADTFRNNDLSVPKKLMDAQKQGNTEVEEEEEEYWFERICPLILGLLRTKRLLVALTSCRAHFENDMKDSLSTMNKRLVDLLVVPSIDDEPTSEETTAANGRSEEAAENEEENKNEKDEHSTEESVSEENLFKGVETVPPESFLAMWSAFMRLIHLRIERAKHLEQCIHRLLALPSLLGKTEPADGIVMSQASTRYRQMSNYIDTAMAKDLAEACRNLVTVTNSVSNVMLTRILLARSSLHCRLSLREFNAIHTAVMDFIQQSENSVESLPALALRGELQSQSRAFVEHQHSKWMAKLSSLLDNETWVRVDVPHQMQVAALLVFSDQSSTDSEDAVEKPSEESNSVKESTAHEKVQDMHSKISLNGQEYCCVNVLMILISSLQQYLEVGSILSHLITDIIAKIAEILSKFNTRMSQLVLGAEAMQVSGLKSITAKHLAMSSQALSMILEGLPGLRAQLSSLLSFQNGSSAPDEARKQLLLTEFDRVGQDLRIHRGEIQTKLVSIMKERLNFHCQQTLTQIVEEWLQERPGKKSEEKDQPTEPSPFAQGLVREVQVLRKVLGPILLKSELVAIFSRVCTLFDTQLADVLEQVLVHTATAGNASGNSTARNFRSRGPIVKKNILNDSTFLLKTLRSLCAEKAADEKEAEELIAAFEKSSKMTRFLREAQSQSGI